MPGHMAARIRTVILDAHGQTASEYLGVLLVVALIVSGLVTLGVPGLIASEVESLIDSISGGDDPNAK